MDIEIAFEFPRVVYRFDPGLAESRLRIPLIVISAGNADITRLLGQSIDQNEPCLANSVSRPCQLDGAAADYGYRVKA